MDWTEQLKAFRDANPDLPEGPEMHDPEPEDTVKRQPRLDIYIERKGRGGKTATLISGWICEQSELLQLSLIHIFVAALSLSRASPSASTVRFAGTMSDTK